MHILTALTVAVIMALVNKSGRRGLSAFLPDSGQTVQVGSNEDGVAQPPHLPLTPTWVSTDFSVSAVVNAATGDVSDGRVNLRKWVLLLLSRYTYMSGMCLPSVLNSQLTIIPQVTLLHTLRR